jgi:type I site-specific restriction endonuclease
LVEAGWGATPCAIGGQRSFTNGRIFVAGGKVRRGKQRRADYPLYYRPDYPLAVVKAREIGLPAETGVKNRMVSGYLLRDIINKTNGVCCSATPCMARRPNRCPTCWSR